MKLIAIQATETKPQSIDILTDNGNKFASVDKFGDLTMYGEDMKLDCTEVKLITVISDNFELFFNNIKNEPNENSK